MQQMTQQLNGGLHPQVIPQEVAGRSFRDFFYMSPSKFHGGLDQVKTHEWITNIEGIFSDSAL